MRFVVVLLDRRRLVDRCPLGYSLARFKLAAYRAIMRSRWTYFRKESHELPYTTSLVERKAAEILGGTEHRCLSRRTGSNREERQRVDLHVGEIDGSR